MKKLLQILTAALVGAAFIGSAAGAQAAQDCDILVINGTGPGSNNQIVCNVTTNATVVCTNNVYVLDANSQTAVSGAASGQGNVTSGTVITGNATNSNGQTVAIGSSCGTVASPSPSPSVTPGGGSVTPTSQKAAALPYTAGTPAEMIVVVSLIAAAAVVAVSRIAVAAYRHFGTK